MKNKSTLRNFLQYYKKVMGLFLLDTFFAIILAGVSIGMPFLTQFIIMSAINSNMHYLFFGIGLLISTLIVRMISSMVVTRWGHIMGIKMEVNMRNDAIKKMQSLPMSHFDTMDTGSYISRIVTDLKDIPEFAHHGPEDFIIATLTSIGAFTYAFLQSWIIGIILIGVFILGIIIIYFIRTKWRKIWKDVKVSNSDMSASVGFQVESIAEIKSYKSEQFERKRFQVFQNEYKRKFYKLYGFEGYFTVTNIFIMSITSIITISLGGYMVANHQINVAQLSGLTATAVALNQPMQKFVNVYTMLSKGSSSVDRFFEFLENEEENLEGVISIPKKFNGEIVFKDVSFSYLGKDNQVINVLKNFNLTIKSGEKVAIIGETGIGKSTILKLMLRFYEINSGKITIDGHDIAKMKVRELRERIGYIQQQSNLFNDTIKNNILYGNPNASNDEIKEAINDAQVNDFIKKLPNGIETIAGPRGAKLSGGQKQRISIARSFITKPDIMLLDEATSALDNETEHKIKLAINKLTQNKTTLIVAHRLTTIRDVDRVLVLGKNGKIVEEGNHKKLMDLKGYYYNMNKIF